MILRYVAIFLVLFGARVYAEPLSLSVTEISRDLAAETVDIKVIELHESDAETTNTVTYTGIPLLTLPGPMVSRLRWMSKASSKLMCRSRHSIWCGIT
jgi:hypothetical protein